MDLFDLAAKITLDSSEYEAGIQKAASSSQTLMSAVRNLADSGFSALAERSNTVGSALQRISSIASGVQSAIQTVSHPIESLKQGFATLGQTVAPAFEAIQHPIETAKTKIQELTQKFQEEQQGAVQNKAFLEQLKIAYQETSEKVGLLTEEYKKSVAESGTTSEKSKELKQKLSEAEQAAGEAAKELEKYGDKAEEAGDKSEKSSEKTSKLAESLKKGFKNLAKGTAGAVGVAGGAIGKVLYDSVSKYADFEQLRDGTKKIFDEVDYSTIAADANDAYKTMGLSASQYLESINQVGSSFASTMGDQKGYETAKLGMQALADYASGTGKSVDLLNEKYQMIARAPSQYLSIADQFSGILPQTTDDFLKQAQAAGFLSGSYKKLTDVPVAEYQEAVTKMLDKGVTAMGFAGNAQREAFGTLSGSINTTKAAWENLVVGLTDSEADLGQLASNLVESGTAMVRNIVPAAKQALGSISKVLPGLVSAVGEEAVSLISDFLPDLVTVAVSLVETLVDTITSNSDKLIDAALKIVSVLLNGLTTAAPKLLTGAMTMIAQLASGLGQALPTLIPQVVDIVMQLALALTNPESLGAILDGALALMKGLADGILEALPLVINAIPTIINNLIQFFVQNAPQFYASAFEIMVRLSVGLIKAIPEVLSKLPEIVDSIAQGLVDLAPQLWEAGKSLAKTAWEGIKSIFTGKKDKVDASGTIDYSGVTASASAAASSLSSYDQEMSEKFGRVAETASTTASSVTSSMAQISTALSGSSDSLSTSGAMDEKFNRISTAATTAATSTTATLTGLNTTAQTAFTGIVTQADAAKTQVQNTFATMGTEATATMAQAVESVDFTPISNAAQVAYEDTLAAFDDLPNQFKAIWEQIKKTYNEVPTWFQKTFNAAYNNIVAIWQKLPSQFTAVWTQIKNDANTSMQELTTNANTWGSDLINNFTQGVDAAAASGLESSLQSVAEQIKSILGFSEPERGPLSNFHTFAPDMMNLFAKGIRDNKKMLTDTVEDAFDFKDLISAPKAFTFSTSGGKVESRMTIQSESDKKVDALISILKQYLPGIANQKIVLDSGTMVGEMLPRIDRGLAYTMANKARGNA